MASLKEKGYQFIEGFLDPKEIDLLTHYSRIAHRTNIHSFDNTQNNNGDTYFYGDPIMEALMISKQYKLEKITGFKLLPTYAFWRMYTYNAELKKHTDRPACEISVTVNINGDGTEWPIFMDGSSVILQPGDGAVYFGEKVEHWREPFLGDWQAQVFMHYVDANGKNIDQVKDGRVLFGTRKK